MSRPSSGTRVPGILAGAREPRGARVATVKMVCVVHPPPEPARPRGAHLLGKSETDRAPWGRLGSSVRLASLYAGGRGGGGEDRPRQGTGVGALARGEDAQG